MSENILRYFPALSGLQLEKLSDLKLIYDRWNRMINVISRKDMDNFLEHHVLHSMSVAKVISFLPGTKILDVGTGGGFPGIPLAIMFPQANFYLIDSIGKKIKVVEEISNALELKNVKYQQIRADELKYEFDFIVSRAVTQLPEFVKWIENKISPINSNTINNGVLYLKGGDITQELKEINKKYRIYNIDKWFEEEYFIEKKIVYIEFILKKIKKFKKR